MHTTPYRFLVAFLSVAGVLLLLTTDFLRAPDSDFAKTIFETCQAESDTVSCYEREIPTLYPKRSIKEVFGVVREVRTLDQSYQFCHVLAHKLGERVVEEDPNRWLEAIALNPPDGLCSNGFVHGVIGGRFRAEVLDEATLASLVPDFSRACEPRRGWNPTPLDRAICYHGMGHLYDFITDADLPKALQLCEETARSREPYDFRRVCREGVFMQIYQPLEPDDYLMIERMEVKPATTTVRSFCSRFERDEYEGACLRESWPFFAEEIKNGTGIRDFCQGQPNPMETDACYETAFSIVGRMNLSDAHAASRACDMTPSEERARCYFFVSKAVLEEDRRAASEAIALCQMADTDTSQSCLKDLVGASSSMFISNSESYREFCQKLPEDLKKDCSY